MTPNQPKATELEDYEAVGTSSAVGDFLRSVAHVFLPATEKMASRGPGGGHEPPVAGTDAAKSRQEVAASSSG